MLTIIAVRTKTTRATKTFQRGIDAHRHPQFYRQLGKVPQELVMAALALLQKRFDLR
jgi:hypothetical protein